MPRMNDLQDWSWTGRPLNHCTETRVLMERPDTDMTSHPSNKFAEMSSAIVFSVRVP
jgi:hypothetical protein